jgi:DNA-binding FadR family transcriptional regulator
MDKSISSTARPERDDPFQTPMRFPKTAELLADDIRKRIIWGELKEGDYLPLEGELKSTLGISRPTLREAFRILETEKLISVVRGSRTGARVHRPTAQAVSRYAGYVLQSQGTTISDIYDARLAIEPFCVRSLARREDKAAADALEAEAAKLTAMVNEKRYTDFLIGLVEFHRLIVQESGNRTLLLITTMLQDVTARYQVAFLRRHTLDEETQHKNALWGLRSFAKLIELIRQGDAQGATAHWHLHLVNANHSWVPKEDEGLLLDVLD